MTVSAFAPRPIAKYTFFDLNGNPIIYSSDSYDSFEVMKRNILTNIDVPKDTDNIYVKDENDQYKLLKNIFSIVYTYINVYKKII